MKKIKVVLISNIPSPYRVDLWYYMQTCLNSVDLTILYTNANEDNRQWDIDEKKLEKSIILNSKILKIKGKQDSRYIHLLSGIGKRLSEINPDIVIAMEYNPAALQALCWCKRNKIGFVHMTDGTLHSERSIGTVQKISRKIIIKRADTYIASSTKAKEKLVKWGANENKISVSLLTTDIKKYKAIKRNPVKGRILYVGSMIPRKGLDLLINCLPFIDSEYCLHIVGNGTIEEIKDLKELAEGKGIDNKIEWKGFKQGLDLLKEYSEAEVFVLPTREDCFGLVLLEATAAGIPVVASKYADGAYDIVEVGKTGWIVDPYNGAELAETINKVIDDINFQKNCYTYSRKMIRKFEFSEVAKGFIDAIGFTLRNIN